MSGAPDRSDLVKSVIWAELAASGPLTRAQLAARTGLPRSTIGDHVRSMLRQHVVREVAAARPSGRGRQARSVALVPTHGLVAVVVLTHSTEIALGDVRTALGTAAGTVRWHEARPSGGEPLTAGIEAIHRGLSALGQDERQLDLIVLVVPMPVIQQQEPTMDGLPCSSVIESLTHVLGPDPVTTLTTEFGVPGILVNDADMAALGEAVHGSGKGHEDLIHLMVVGGIGMGVVLEGHTYARPGQLTPELTLLYSPESVEVSPFEDTEWWRVVVPWRLRVERRVGLRWGIPGDSLAAVRAGCAAGDSQLDAALQAVGEAIGAALAPFVVLSGIRFVTLQQELEMAFDPIASGLSLGLRRLPAWPQLDVEIVRGVLGPLAPVLGALELVRGATSTPVDRRVRHDPHSVVRVPRTLPDGSAEVVRPEPAPDPAHELRSDHS